jgi:hypothetical protein
VSFLHLERIEAAGFLLPLFLFGEKMEILFPAVVFVISFSVIFIVLVFLEERKRGGGWD